MMNKKLISAIIIILILVVGIYLGFFKKEKPIFTLAEVIRGDISQEVSETGQVKKGEKINLSFKNAGRIEKIYVKVGEEVKTGDILAKLETEELKIQLKEAEAALSLTKTQLSKLLAGASQEEIKVAQTKVENSQISLDSANQTLKDANEDALNVLDDCYLKAYNSQNTVDSIQRTYFLVADQESIKVRENKEKIEKAVSQIKSLLDASAISQIKTELANISEALKIIRETCEVSTYYNRVSSTDKTSLDTQRTNINTAITNLANAQQAIISAKLSIDSAKGQLQVAKDNLALITAPAREEDIDFYQAQVDQALAKVKLLENQIENAALRSPAAGQITEIKKRVGEMVQPSSQDLVATILPADPFTIKVDIYEEDVVKMQVGNEVGISLIPFPDKTFRGKVVSIDPAAKVIEGVVYYEALIDFEEMPENLKSGMTADLIIKTASKNDVLVIPEDAVQKRDDKTTVEVSKNGKMEEREVEIGLFGSSGMVEVISGLEEGEKVIVR